MARIELRDPREADDPAVREWARKVTFDGSVPAHFRAETAFPAVMMKVFDAHTALARHREIGPELFLKIAVAVSLANDCAYCAGSFCGRLKPRLGGEEAVREFQVALAEDELEGREADLIDFALSINDDPHAVTDEDFDALREEHDLSDRGFVGLVYAVNIVAGWNRVTVGFDLAYDAPYPEEWADPDSLPGRVG